MIAHASAVLTVVLSLGGADVAGLPLAKDGQTSYQIVKPANPSAVDEYMRRTNWPCTWSRSREPSFRWSRPMA